MNDKLITTTRGDVTQVAASPKRPASEGSNTLYRLSIYLFGQSKPFMYYVQGMTRIASIRGDFDAKRSQSYTFRSAHEQGTIGLNWANAAAIVIEMVQPLDVTDYHTQFLYLDKADANSA